MLQKGLRVSAKSVMPKMLKCNKTFSDVKEKYGMTDDELKKVLERVVDDREYPRLVKKDAKYSKIRKNMPNKKKISSKPTENAVTGNLNTMKERDVLEEKLKRVDKEVEEKIKKQQKKKANLKNAESELEQAKETRQKADSIVSTAEKKCKKLRNEEVEIVSYLKSLIVERETLTEQIKKLDERVIFLVAPGYHGELPQYGTKISVVPMEGKVKTEDVSDITLVDMTLQDAFEFETIAEAKAANQYLKLVAKYFLNDKEYKLLVDNELMLNILRKQQLIENET